MLFFEKHQDEPPEKLQTLGVAMLFLSLEHNSDLVFGSLKYLNTLHKVNGDHRFQYSHLLVNHLQFNSYADHFMDDFLLTMYACTESPFNGARQEALSFFEYWIIDDKIATKVFQRITKTWPWTNRNKYYFLSILFEKHSFYSLLNTSVGHIIDAEYLLTGVTVSLQYRNLISPGQTLAITLTKQEIPECFEIIAKVLRHGSTFEMQNCINHWMRCIWHSDRIFDLLNLDSEQILDGEEFRYLHEENMLRLVLFRSSFRKCFERLKNVREIDKFIKSKDSQFDIVHKIPIFDVIITNTMNHIDQLDENLDYLEKFLKSNMHEECSALRHDIMKLMPNLLYLFANLIKSDENVPRIQEFFRYIKIEIFEYGVQQDVYQYIIFGLRIYEIVMKTLYGSKSDRLIKKFNIDINNRLKAFLSEENLWNLCSDENYAYLLNLLRSDYDDVRDIACELAIRFFSSRDINTLCESAISHEDIHQCSYAHYLARVAIHFSNNETLYSTLRNHLNAYLNDYNDPFQQVKSGKHLFSVLNCINELYNVSNFKYIEQRSWEFAQETVYKDIDLTCRISTFLLNLLKVGSGNKEGENGANIGSPSFEKMDANLTQLVESSRYPHEYIHGDKKFLLLSIWMSLKVRNT